MVIWGERTQKKNAQIFSKELYHHVGLFVGELPETNLLPERGGPFGPHTGRGPPPLEGPQDLKWFLNLFFSLCHLGEILGMMGPSTNWVPAPGKRLGGPPVPDPPGPGPGLGPGPLWAMLGLGSGLPKLVPRHGETTPRPPPASPGPVPQGGPPVWTHLDQDQDLDQDPCGPC